jgi:hypothetical protein
MVLNSMPLITEDLMGTATLTAEILITIDINYLAFQPSLTENR